MYDTRIHIPNIKPHDHDHTNIHTYIHTHIDTHTHTHTHIHTHMYVTAILRLQIPLADFLASVSSAQSQLRFPSWNPDACKIGMCATTHPGDTFSALGVYNRYHSLITHHSLKQSLTHSLTHLLLTQSLTHSLTHSITHSLHHSLPHSITQSLPHTLTPFLPHSLTHSYYLLFLA
jgi:hypothetical protein